MDRGRIQLYSLLFTSTSRNIPCLHGDPIAGSNPGSGSDPSAGVALTRVYTVITFTEQTPQLGQIGSELGVYITKFRALAAV